MHADERLRRGDGVLVAAVGTAWMAFSPATGLTVLLNDESAAILEALEPAPRSVRQLAASLLVGDADDAAVEAALRMLAPAWPTLIDAGLVDRADGD